MDMREFELLDLSQRFRHVARWRGLSERDADTVAFEFLLHLLSENPKCYASPSERAQPAA